MDILFKTDDFIFSYRVGGILIQNEKILLQRSENDDYAIIGGHTACMETTADTLKREFEEELHAKIVSPGIPLDSVFHGYDDLDNERIDLDFCWVLLEEIKNGTKVYPLELVPHILEPKKRNRAFYFISVLKLMRACWPADEKNK